MSEVLTGLHNNKTIEAVLGNQNKTVVVEAHVLEKGNNTVNILGQVLGNPDAKG